MAQVDILTEYWRYRAEKARDLAGTAASEETRQTMLSLAEICDYLGDLAARYAPALP